MKVKEYDTALIMVDKEFLMATLGYLVLMQVLACRGLMLTVKGEGRESEGDFVRFNDKYRLRKRREENMNVGGGVYKILLDPGGSGSHLQLEVGQAKWSTLIGPDLSRYCALIG